MKDKILLFTHGIDIDGYGCAILAKLAFGDDVEIVYADNFDLDDKFIVRVWQNGYAAKNVKQIFVTDHCPSMAMCAIIDKSNIKDMLKVIDHHKSRFGNQDKFDFAQLLMKKMAKKNAEQVCFTNTSLTKACCKKQTCC